MQRYFRGSKNFCHYVYVTKTKFVLLIVFTVIVMVTIDKTMDYFICKNYLLQHNKKYYYKH